MTTIFIVLLFVMQIISFYFLALLFTKISNFDNLEKKQRMLMDEMDDSITVYLSEIKDENDRLINELTSKVNQTEKNHNPVVDRINNLQEQPSKIDLKTPVIPLNIALKSYGTTKLKTEQAEEQGLKDQGLEEQKLKEQGLEELGPEGLLETDERTRAIRLFDAGESIEDIAKTLGKGRTEVELILKFR